MTTTEILMGLMTFFGSCAFGVLGVLGRRMLLSMDALNLTVGKLNTKVAVLQVSQDRIADHEQRLRALESGEA